MQVAEHDDAERHDAACAHEDNHVRLHPRVRAAAEYIRATGSLQAMGPVPGDKGQHPVLMQAGQPRTLQPRRATELGGVVGFFY